MVVSFRQIEHHRNEEARAQVAALKHQINAEPAALSRQQHTAQVRAAREQEDRVNKPLTRMPELERSKNITGQAAEDRLRLQHRCRGDSASGSSISSMPSGTRHRVFPMDFQQGKMATEV